MQHDQHLAALFLFHHKAGTWRPGFAFVKRPALGGVVFLSYKGKHLAAPLQVEGAPALGGPGFSLANRPALGGAVFYYNLASTWRPSAFVILKPALGGLILISGCPALGGRPDGQHLAANLSVEEPASTRRPLFFD